MKTRIIPVALLLMLSVLFVGCGGKNAVSDDPSAIDSAPVSNGAKVDDSTVAGRLAKAGLKLDDIKPDSFAAETLFGCGEDEIAMYITGKGQLGEAVMKPMVMKIIDATAAISDDGKTWEPFYGLGEPEPLDLGDPNWNAYNFVGQWSYQKDGQWICATLGVVPADEEGGQDNYDYMVTLSFLY
jgi:hypothetical protein